MPSLPTGWYCASAALAKLITAAKAALITSLFRFFIPFPFSLATVFGPSAVDRFQFITRQRRANPFEILRLETGLLAPSLISLLRSRPPQRFRNNFRPRGRAYPTHGTTRMSTFDQTGQESTVITDVPKRDFCRKWPELAEIQNVADVGLTDGTVAAFSSANSTEQHLIA